MRPATFVPESKPVDDLLSRDAGGPHPPGRSSSTSTAARPAWSPSRTSSRRSSARSPTSTTSSARRSSASTTAAVRVTARLPVEDLGELFDVELPADEVETVGGLLAQALGRVPIPGAAATVGGLQLVAEGTTGRRNRIDTVLVRRVADAEPGRDDADDRGEHDPPMPERPRQPRRCLTS